LVHDFYPEVLFRRSHHVYVAGGRKEGKDRGLFSAVSDIFEFL
jgi:hypothetical protein